MDRSISRADLDREHPFNTYRIRGLPPGPIANPGRAALAAVLDPPASDNLFFVADGSGGHVFAVTYDDHLKNVAKWRVVEKQRAAAALQEKAGALQEKAAEQAGR